MIEIQQRDADGKLLATMTFEPGQSFSISGSKAAVQQVASPLIHALRSLGAADVTLESNDTDEGPVLSVSQHFGGSLVAEQSKT